MSKKIVICRVHGVDRGNPTHEVFDVETYFIDYDFDEKYIPHGWVGRLSIHSVINVVGDYEIDSLFQKSFIASVEKERKKEAKATSKPVYEKV